MSSRSTAALSRGAALLVAMLATSASAHHAIGGKFDESKSLTLTGVVTRVDWRNPHAHIFINVDSASEGVVNWAVELDSPVLLQRSGWNPDTVKPGDAVTVEGPAARDDTRQIWGGTLTLNGTGREVLYVSDATPGLPKAHRPTPRWPDGAPMLGAPDAQGGYWGAPTETALIEEGAVAPMDPDGSLHDIDDAARVAPLQPWALGVYSHRQRRNLRDDPLFINCKPPGGVRHFQSGLGVQLVEDRERQRIFVLMGSGNHNYRIIYLDDREQQGQIQGDDDNPLYYGRSVGSWEGDTLVVDTTGFNEDFWFTNGGLPHTNQLRLVERFSRPDFDTLRYEVTVYDAGAYTRPWSSSWELKWVGGEELPQYFCQANRS